jgi:branched-chain amino acid transport system ATP-binding protein
MTKVRNSLVVQNLSASYGSIRAVRDVSIKVPQGSVVAVIGRNGAGKSTLLNGICGVIKIDGGKVLYGSNDVTNYPSQKLAKAGIALVPEGRKIIAPLTVRENIALSKTAKRGRSEDLENWVYELFPQLKVRLSQYAGSLSGGEQQMLAISRAIMTNPELVVLDEPSMGLAPLVVEKVFESLISINNSGISLLIVEQDANLALAVADYVYVMQQGEVLEKGFSSDLAKSEVVASGYFS